MTKLILRMARNLHERFPRTVSAHGAADRESQGAPGSVEGGSGESFNNPAIVILAICFSMIEAFAAGPMTMRTPRGRSRDN
jgi:hypothetical protein